MQLPKQQLEIEYDTVVDEYPLLKTLYIVGKHYNLLPFDKTLLNLTHTQLQIIMSLISQDLETQTKSHLTDKATEVYVDTDFEKEFADVLSEVTKTTDSVEEVIDSVQDWVDIPPPPPK